MVDFIAANLGWIIVGLFVLAAVGWWSHFREQQQRDADIKSMREQLEDD